VDVVDFLGYLLRQLGRHLTAYNLVTFHHRGANYPDALLLDAVLQRLLVLVEKHAELFRGSGIEPQRRRRALRQACLLRRHYEDLPVPDMPTSPGENARVLPAPHVRVPEEQILQTSTRRRHLYADDPLDRYLHAQSREVLAESVRDLADPAEWRELGLALFIDRPLGVFKPPLAPDQTLLFAHEAFSPSLARVRLGELRDRLGLDMADLPASGKEPTGLPLSEVQCEEGRIVSLADMRRAGPDFALLRTTRQTIGALLEQYDFAAVHARLGRPLLTPNDAALVVPAPCPPGAAERVLVIYDGRLQKRAELALTQQGYRTRRGCEVLREGFEVRRVWEKGEGEQVGECRGLGVPPRTHSP
jgi:hypothetical protein